MAQAVGRIRKAGKPVTRPSRPWFRLYVETFSDYKIRRLTPEQRWLWVAILGAARQSPEPGTLHVAPDTPMTAAELAHHAALDEALVGPALEEMARLDMVSIDEAGVVRVTHWSERQYESDTSAPRVAKFRAKKRYMERFSNVTCNAPDTETETDTERGALRATRPTKLELDDALREWAKAKVPNVDLEHEREGWLLWCASKGATFKDHRAAFQTWCRRAHERITPSPAQPVAGGATRAVLGRGLDAPPVWELDDDGTLRRADQ